MSKILIIDDDPMAVRMIGFMLKKKGHTALSAENGDEGLAKLSAEKPALTLLDVEMPDENGIDVLRQIRADSVSAGAKVCLMTGTPAAMETTAKGISFSFKSGRRIVQSSGSTYGLTPRKMSSASLTASA